MVHGCKKKIGHQGSPWRMLRLVMEYIRCCDGKAGCVCPIPVCSEKVSSTSVMMLDVDHFGIVRTLMMIWCSYYWEGMQQDAEDYIGSCTSCQTSKSTTVKPAGCLHSLPVL